MTHKGKIIGCDSRTPDGYFADVQLRETKTLWVAHDGRRFRKHNGMPSGGVNFPRYRLDLSSIVPLENKR